MFTKILCRNYCVTIMPIRTSYLDPLLSLLKDLLSSMKLNEKCVFQVFNKDYARTPEAYALAAHYVFNAFTHKENLLRDRNLEFLVYNALDHNFGKAVKKAGFRAGEPNCLVIVCRDITQDRCKGIARNASSRLSAYIEKNLTSLCMKEKHIDAQKNLYQLTRFYIEEVC